jgi:hypothetical protein
MKLTAQVLKAAFLFASIGLAAHGLIVPGNITATVPEPGSVLETGTPPSRDPAQGLPGQPGTIPERIQPPGASSQQEMVISAEEIKRAQEALKSKGYDPGAVSGRMHAKTQEALREFQKKNKLTPTGVLDKNTADKLGVIVPDETGSQPKSPR